ncbi:hypothetical protein [Trujillonella endophytica]|uniref:Uncharacterized protein n=1 Tax=Trujillonella endophytica TaxID=673521 RepID=A0A1H8UP12_9ACTN|nr:hypothetical protein [Trujillella endophytica]SEP04952.1 hypothetical protein SAMN05660991_02981 [Trujillella endophytica]
MRVQRAPRAADQPQRAPEGFVRRVAGPAAVPPPAPAPAAVLPPAPAPAAVLPPAPAMATASPPAPVPSPAGGPGGQAAGVPFSAEVDLDVTRLAERPADDLFAEVVAALVVACAREGLIDDGSALRIVAPTDGGLAGARADRAVDRSAHAVAALRGSLGADVPSADGGTLTVVDARATRARPLGDWGLGVERGIATLGPVVSTVVSYRRSSGLVLGERRSARLAVTVPDGGRAAQVVRALDAVARAVEETIR